MKRHCLYPIFTSLFLFLISPSDAKPQGQENEVVVPAGTLLRCTLTEPNFSSKTVDVGDPVVCPLAGLTMFNRYVFPRGAYLGGHLEAVKEPGRLVGKGYLKLTFDHIGLPNDQIPVPAKMIGASGYKVDKEGKIIGHGHATRDAVEWLIPPLWPLKVMTLPARGPRPTLKGEEQFTLRLMDDVLVPATPLSRSTYRGASSSNVLPVPPASPAKISPIPDATGTTTRVPQHVLALRNGTSYVVTGLLADGDQLSYRLSNGSLGRISLDDVDWTKTFQENAENGAALAMIPENAPR
jgi:hypothetical protein